MAEKIRKVTDQFWVAPQLAPAEIAEAAALGVTAIVNNRPDGEMLGQPKSADIEAAAQAAGIAYAFIPVDGRGIGPDHLDALDQARRAAGDGAMLAYCKSGLRSVVVYAYAAARAGRPPADIIAEAAKAGYDIAAHEPALAALAAPA